MNLAVAVFSILKGKWHLNRVVNGFGMMEGEAIFLPLFNHPYTLGYREEGIFKTAQRGSFDFYKEYIFSLAQGYIEVHFSYHYKKLSLFHKLNFLPSNFPLIATATHHCRYDCYETTYRFLNVSTFTLLHNVEGPKKRYVIRSLFNKFQ